MRLLGLTIYGFGKFENYEIEDVSTELQLIFGENEAGKSTLISFVEYVLFGFPSRQENYYEMNHLSRFGGSLFVEESGEAFRIERTRDRNSENLYIYFRDGTSGNSDDLKKLLKGMNRASFRQIYFCNLTTLNNDHHYDEEAWNQVLYEAGMSGGASLLEIEKNFDKWQGEIFKPGGRKPQLNQDVESYESLKKKTNEWEKKNENYNELIKKTKELEIKVQENAERLQFIQNEQRKLEREKHIIPLLNEKKRLEEEIENLPEFHPFPEEGLIRMDKWKEQAVLLSGELEGLKKRKERLENDIHHAQLLPNSSAFLQEVSYWNEEMILYRGRAEERRRLQSEIRSLNTTLESELMEFGQTEEALKSIHPTFTGRESLKQLVASYQLSDQKYQYIQEAFLSARDELEKEENEYDRLKTRLLSPKDRERLEKEQSSSTNQKWSFGVIAVALLVFIILGIYESWLLGFVAAAIVVGGAILMRMTSKSTETKSEDEVLIRDRELRRQAESLKDQVDRLNRTYLKAAEKVDLWEAERYQLDDKLKEWRTIHAFPEYIPTDSLLDAFDRIGSSKKVQTERNQKQQQIEDLDYSLTVVEDRIKKLCERANVSYQEPDKAIQLLLQKAEEQRELMRDIDLATNKLQELEEQLGGGTEKWQSCNDEMNKLMRLAGEDNEEAFRVKGKAHKEAQELKRQLAMITSQLSDESFVEHTTVEEIDYHREQLEHEETSIMKKQQGLYQQIASENEQIRLLTEDGTYEELLLQRQQKEDEINSLAWKWSVLKVASDFLTRAKARYQEERLPAVIKKAESYFNIITEGRYTAIYPPVEGNKFRVLNVDGRAYKPSELSRGTAEQLYLCIRLSLASISTVQMPIFLDDIFVNFDEKRTDVAKAFIKRFSKDNQVILLTCHSSTTVGIDDRIHILDPSPASTKKGTI
ncbi:AAA family ATPase [Pseudalkalibacillus sp. NRS-1564]|uniref:ATP-binding protein n=1 Tax=Pseudalkalibacillus sp. NRS-1564 TaxID=3233900 RepID=UPI003D286A7E